MLRQCVRFDARECVKQNEKGFSMESVRFGPNDSVLTVRCLDGRTEAPVCGVLPKNLHQLRLAGGILAPLHGARKDPSCLQVLEEFFIDQIMGAVDLKKPVAIVIVTHSGCGVANALGIDDCSASLRTEMIISELISRGVSVPIYGAHDDHCKDGDRRVFRLVQRANVTDVHPVTAAA